MSEWHPIETAPKDGRRILAYSADGGVQCLFWARDDEPMWDEWNTPDGYTVFPPTHWMPLPEPPVSP